MSKLEHWSIQAVLDDEYQAPETARTILCGYIYNDSRFKEGTFVTTSTLRYFDPESKKAKTNNTEYELGEIDVNFSDFMESNGFKLTDYKLV